MAILPNDLTASTVIAASEIQENDEALEAVLDGGITQLNMDSSTRIPNGYLANNDFTFNIQLRFRQTPTTSSWLVGSTGVVQDTAALPYDSTEGVATYTILSAHVSYRHTDATLPDFQIDWGYLDANGAWQQTTSIVASTAISDTDTVTATIGALQATLTLANSSVSTSASQERVFALRNATTDAWATTAGDFLSITLKIKRELRS